jgi:hypothetical protein
MKWVIINGEEKERGSRRGRILRGRYRRYRRMIRVNHA